MYSKGKSLFWLYAGASIIGSVITYTLTGDAANESYLFPKKVADLGLTMKALLLIKIKEVTNNLICSFLG
jgi:hypothetical protein